MIEGTEKLREIHDLAACLTAESDLRRDLVRRMATYLLDRRNGGHDPAAAPQPLAEVLAQRLSSRQLEVWNLLVSHHGIREIGRALGISHVAVIKLRERILKSVLVTLDQADNGSPVTAARLPGTPPSARSGFVSTTPPLTVSSWNPRTLGAQAVRLILVATCFCFSAPSSPAAPRPLSDAEMDQVCAKGSVGFDVDLSTIQEIVFAFSHHSASAQVDGSIHWKVEANTLNPAQVQVLIGDTPVVPNAPVNLQELETIEIRAIDAQVRVTGDINLSIKTAPHISRALQEHQALIDHAASLARSTGRSNRGLGRFWR